MGGWGAAIAGVASALAELASIGFGIYQTVETGRAKRRTSAETTTRMYYDAIENRLGVSLSQIDQFLDDLGFKNTRAMDLIRGTARSGVASKIYRTILQEYPEVKSKYLKARNDIQGIINNLMAEEERASAEIQSSSDPEVNLSKIASDLGQGAWKANQIMTELNSKGSTGQDASRPNGIDTNLGSVTTTNK